MSYVPKVFASFLYSGLKISDFVPKKGHLREVLIHYFLLKKSAAESYRILQGVYGEHCLSQNTCERWFNRFKIGDFDKSDKERPSQSLMEKRPEWAKRHERVILLHDNAPSHTTKLVKATTEKLGREDPAHPLYSPDLAPPDYHLFSSMADGTRAG